MEFCKNFEQHSFTVMLMPMPAHRPEPVSLSTAKCHPVFQVPSTPDILLHHKVDFPDAAIM